MTENAKDEFVPGMYGEDDPRCPKVQIGRFIISRQSETTVWIKDTIAYDAGSFPDADVEAVLLEYYTKAF